MINDINELVFVQTASIVVLLLIFWIARKKKKERIAYCCISVVYVFIIGWLIYEYFRLGSHPDPGSVFAWAMTSIILPGVLILIAIGIFIIARLSGKRKME